MFTKIALLGFVVLFPVGILAQGPNEGDNVQIDTRASWVDPNSPSSEINTFVMFLYDNIGTGRHYWKECTIMEQFGLPADGALKISNCQYTTQPDDAEEVGGKSLDGLTFIKFRWQHESQLNNGSMWVQFMVLNDLGTGKWVRYYAPNGTRWSAVVRASGDLTYTVVHSHPGGPNPYSLELPPPSPWE